MSVRSLALLALLAALLAVTAGCFLKREEGTNRTILKKGWQVDESMAGWVAVPDHKPAGHSAQVEVEETDQETGKVRKTTMEITYYRLATLQVVPVALDGYYAFNPQAFAKLTKIKLDPLGTKAPTKWEMRVGRRVTEDKDGWIGVAEKYPKVEMSEKGSGSASLAADLLVPQEMDGWAAISTDTLNNLAEKRILSSGTIRKKDKPAEKDGAGAKEPQEPKDPNAPQKPKAQIVE